VYEIALGTPLRDVLALAGGAPGSGGSGASGGSGIQAILAGGFFGTWLAGRDSLQVPASAAGLRAAGASFGAGILLVLPPGGCGLAETARVLRYLAGQSAGQCGPCRLGLPEIADAMEQVAFRAASGRVLRSLHELFGLVEGRGACHLPDGAVRLAVSALRVFADDVKRHQRGPCSGAAGRPVFAVPGVS
jgi:NADH:ubiquinone oxidoreductase subunit F (NADH-binding)